MAEPTKTTATQAEQLGKIAEEVRSLREVFAPTTVVDDEKVANSKEVAASLRSSLVRVGRSPTGFSARWDGAALTEIKFGDAKASQKWVTVILSSGAKFGPNQINNEGSATFPTNQPHEAIRRVEIRGTREGPCLGIGGPIHVAEPVATGGIE